MLSYVTVDVFTDEAFGGNPLAVVFGAEELSTVQMLQIAKEFNYSETTFVLPPADARAHTARVRIFTPSGELPFAGHPNIGTATVLGWRGEVFGRAVGAEMVFEEDAGLVAVTLLPGQDGRPAGARLVAPQRYSSAGAVGRSEVAACLGLAEEDIEVANHAPLVGSVGLPFVLVELASLAALERCRAVPGLAWRSLGRDAALLPAGDEGIHAYVRCGPDSDGVDVRARMHGEYVEDPATGSANCALLGLLATEVAAGEASGDGTLRVRIAQGVEMGRPSILDGEADYGGGEAGEVRIGGLCVPMMRGELLVGRPLGGGGAAAGARAAL